VVSDQPATRANCGATGQPSWPGSTRPSTLFRWVSELPGPYSRQMAGPSVRCSDLAQCMKRWLRQDCVDGRDEPGPGG
jgi:hypothetical protein